jgi:glutamate/tyrosine decarboxylase-like PLP-dependent enzyme
MAPDAMRALGEEALELVLQHWATLRDDHTMRSMPRAEAEARLRTPIPEEATPVSELLEVLTRDVFPYAFKAHHPRFYSFVPSPTNFVSVVGDFLMSGHNVFAGHWLASSGAAQIELTVLEWLRDLCGLPATGGGIFVSGGSMANLSAIVTARETRLGGHDPKAVVYCSDQTHSSMAKGLRVLGFSREQRRTVATDDQFRLSIPALEAAIAADRAAGFRPFCVVANAGTTNTGAIDPLPGLADLCAREGLWLHVDGAYGAAAVLTERGKAALAGLERADSITLDPHKWLFQPYELGCLLVRDASLLRQAFRVEEDDHADYLADVSKHIQEDVNFFERGIQLTRSFKALKLWLSMRAFGVSEFRRGVQVGFDRADLAERLLKADGRWEIVTPSQMGIVSFRWSDSALTMAQIEALTHATVERMRVDGYASVMSTMLRGRAAFRLCPINPATTDAEITETVARLTRFSAELAAELAAELVAGTAAGSAAG